MVIIVTEEGRFWNHENPYTGLKNCDDPVFAMVEIVNESGLFIAYKDTFPAFRNSGIRSITVI